MADEKPVLALPTDMILRGHAALAAAIGVIVYEAIDTLPIEERPVDPSTGEVI